MKTSLIDQSFTIIREMSQFVSPSGCLRKHHAPNHRRALSSSSANHHHIPAAWHRLRSHGNRTTCLPLPLVSWQLADEMRQSSCAMCGCVYACVSRDDHMLASRILGHTYTHMNTVFCLQSPFCCNNLNTRLLVYYHRWLRHD